MLRVYVRKTFQDIQRRPQCQWHFICSTVQLSVLIFSHRKEKEILEEKSTQFILNIHFFIIIDKHFFLQCLFYSFRCGQASNTSATVY